jgi:hypothetical protein
LTLKGDENAVGAGIGRWGCDDATFGHDLSGELAADPAEVVAIEKIGFAVFAQGKDHPLTREVQRKRVATAEIGIAR